MSRRDTLPTAVRWGTRGLLLLSLAMVGCESPRASVSGIVTFKGQPLPSGTVLLHGADGRVEHALITEDGRFTITNAPLGTVRITVQSHPAVPTGLPTRGGKPPAAPTELAPPAKEKHDNRSVPIPPRYLDPEKSGLTYTVRAGTQTHDIELKP
jgi:hypothetical protein